MLDAEVESRHARESREVAAEYASWERFRREAPLVGPSIPPESLDPTFQIEQDRADEEAAAAAASPATPKLPHSNRVQIPTITLSAKYKRKKTLTKVGKEKKREKHGVES